MNSLINKFIENNERINENNLKLEEIINMELELKEDKTELKKTVKATENENKIIKKLIYDQCNITGENIPNEIINHENNSENENSENNFEENKDINNLFEG